MTFSTQLFATLDLIVPALAQEGRPLGCNTTSLPALKTWLIRLWQLIRSSVPLMEAAHQELVLRHQGEPFTEQLSRYLLLHIEEERHHDTWLLEDLKELGCDPDELLISLPHPAVAELAGSQYYCVRHHHPVTLLGYIALSEGYPPQPQWLDRLAAESHTPSSAWRTLRLHASEDVAHRAELARLLDALPQNPAWYRQAVLGNAVRSVFGWSRALGDLASGKPDGSAPRPTGAGS